MEECQCSKHGFCDYYNQNMTYDPPNWQWCQSASEQDRIKYKQQCEKKQARKEIEEKVFLSGEYITNSQFIKDCRDLLLPKIAKLNLKGVIGIPRSGMFPASMIAMWLNLPIYHVDALGSPRPLSAASRFGGVRMLKYKGSNGSLLVVDDTIYSGKSIKNFMPRMTEDFYTCCVYFRPESEFKPDFYARELNAPHLLEWNLFNSTHTKNTLFDFDGILCPNVPQEVCKDEDKYIDYISTVEPFYHRIPNTSCAGIVTARLEKYRDITENWLKKYGINYGFLKMYPTEDEAKRDKNHVEEASTFKANAFLESDAKFFIESEISEAIRIRKKTGKFVICPEEKDG